MPPRNADARQEKMLSKLLSRVAGELGRLRIAVTADVMEEARQSLLSRWQQHGGGLSNSDIRQIVLSLKSTITNRSQSALEAKTTLPELPPAQPRAATPSESEVIETTSLLLQTTKKQRKLMADREWIEAAENDRVDGVEGKKREKMQHLAVMNKQKQILDRQMDERQRQKEFERLEKLRRQQEMNETIAFTKEQERQEHLANLMKAQRERDFREKQQREIEADRERNRIEEHNEQVRMVAMNQEELRRQRENDQAKKLREQEEWKKTVAENQLKLAEKEKERERIRDNDREYQRKFIEAQDKQERDRAEAKMRKETRAAYFQKLASGVAQLFTAKAQDQSAKIEAEYEAQMQRSLEDERERVRRGKLRLHQCLEVQQSQIAERKIREQEEKDDLRRYAAGLRLQALEASAAEDAKRAAARQEAVRTKEFLSTQLQMAHFKETRPLETSIARPLSRAQNMYSPSRYSSVSPAQ